MRDGGVVFQFTKQVPPGGEGLGDAESHESEIGLCEDEDRDGDPELRQKNRPQVGQQMNKEQADAFTARGASLQYEVRVTKAADAGMHHASGGGPAEKSEEREGYDHGGDWRHI